jgi:hypothetical protein
MEVRRDPRSFLFLIVLLLLLNSPEPQQTSHNTRSRYDEVIQREWHHLDVLNRTRHGDFEPSKNKWLNVTGLRHEDGFAWDMLSDVKEAARTQAQNVYGEDGWQRVLDGTLGEAEGKPPVYKNLSGYVQGEWVRDHLSRVRHPADLGNASTIPVDPFTNHPFEFDRNLTGPAGPVRLHITEIEDKEHTAVNKTISKISAKVVIGDDSTFGGNWWQFLVHGVHHLESGHAVLTTTSERYAGVFALPHLQISPHLYSTSQQFLNGTIADTIAKQMKQNFPVWNPWTSSTATTDDDMGAFSHHCEFVIYLQEHPSPYGGMDMDWLEHEMRYPTGAPIPRHSLLAMSMVGFSPDCGFVIESKGPPDHPRSEALHLMGSKTEDYNHRARQSILGFAISFAFQLSLLIKQMKDTATPSMRSRVSFYTIALMALGDGLTFLVLIFMYLFLGTAQLVMYSIAFFALFSVLAHLRFLMDIWSVQLTERVRQERQQAAAASTSGSSPAPNTPSPGPPSDLPAAPPTASPTAPPTDGGLPLPATASRPRPPTPIIIAPDQDDPDEDLAPSPNNTTAATATAAPDPQAEFGTLYSRFCLLLIVIFFVTIQFATVRSMYRSIYFDIMSFLYLSFWVPQIYRNVMRNCRKALRWDYVIGTSVFRIIPIAYFYLKEDNILFSRTDWTGFAVLVGWMWIQISALASQEVLGPRFFIKEGWAPPAYDYHPLLREDEEGANMPLNITTSSPSSSADAGFKSTGEPRTKGIKLFDCSICAQDVEVPLIPAGADESSIAGLGGTGMILQRRLYMVTPCRHVFHTGCLEGWMRYRLMCPNCREALPPL